MGWGNGLIRAILTPNRSSKALNFDLSFCRDPVEANAQADQDDGFESLNSQGSSEDSKGDSGDFPAAGPQADDDEIGEATDPELVPVANQRASPEAVFRNNWLEQSARRASRELFL